MMMMVYYSNLQLGRWGSQVMKQMDLDMFRSMVNDCKLIDPQAPTCRALNELDSVFVVCVPLMLPATQSIDLCYLALA